MEVPKRQVSFGRQVSFQKKKMTKQLTGKRDDSPLHSAARGGNLVMAMEIMCGCGENVELLKELLLKQNQSGETALYVAAESGCVDVVRNMIKHYDINSAAIKARNGYDAFHIASKQGDLEVVKVLMESIPQLSMTVDLANTTALHSAAAQGHIEVVNFLLEGGSNLATIAKSNGKTALHSAARNMHLEVVKALLSKEPGIARRSDKKGQTALHMAVKGQNIEIVDELIKTDPSLTNVVDTKGNTALHIATRKGRAQIVRKLLSDERIDTEAINKSGETALDTAEKSGHSEITSILKECGVQSAKTMNPQTTANPARELKQTVSDIKHGVHNQLEHTRQTRKRMQTIAKRINKLHGEGLNNAINSTTVVAVLIATVAFAAIFTVPGQYADDPEHIPLGFSLGEANVAPKPEFIVFFISDSFALFISLAVVVVQTSVVVIERKAKTQLMAIINKLMWLACVMVSIAFIALTYIVVGDDEKWLAVGVTGIGTVIMATTLSTMCYWVIVHRIEASKLRSRRSSLSRSRSMSGDSEKEYKTVYAI